MMKRYHYNFTGRVQGVGFRFTLRNMALQYQLTGWVKNNYDGSVEAEVQGEDYLIDAVIKVLNNDLYIHIEKMTKKEMTIIENDHTFTVKF